MRTIANLRNSVYTSGKNTTGRTFINLLKLIFDNQTSNY
jgi:hypothetical protein